MNNDQIYFYNEAVNAKSGFLNRHKLILEVKLLNAHFKDI